MSDKTPTTYLIVDKFTGALDWDGDLHPSVESCITSLCTSFTRTQEEADLEDGTPWFDCYEIRRVLPLANYPVQYREFSE